MATKREIKIAKAAVKEYRETVGINYDENISDDTWSEVIDCVPYCMEEERKEFEEKFNAFMMPGECDWFKRFHLNEEEYEDVKVDSAWRCWKIARGLE